MYETYLAKPPAQELKQIPLSVRDSNGLLQDCVSELKERFTNSLNFLTEVDASRYL